jgi:hypothetical protein
MCEFCGTSDGYILLGLQFLRNFGIPLGLFLMFVFSPCSSLTISYASGCITFDNMICSALYWYGVCFIIFSLALWAFFIKDMFKKR